MTTPPLAASGHPVSRRGFLGAAGVTLAASCLPALGAARRIRRAEPVFAFTELRPGLFVSVSQRLGGNVIACKSDLGGFVIDASFAGVGPALFSESTERAGDVKFLISTHHHGDHTGGNVAFGPGVVRIAHENAAPRILESRDRYLDQLRGAMRQFGNEQGEINPAIQAGVESLLEREEELKAEDWAPNLLFPKEPFKNPLHGEVSLHWNGPGHTDNDLLVMLTRHDVLHTGDLCFNGLHAFFDRPGGASARGWVTSIAKARELCGEKTVVVPGHGPVGDRTLLDAQRTYLEALIENVTREIRAGKTREEVVQMSWPFMDGLGFPQARPRALGAVYDELVGEIGHP